MKNITNVLAIREVLRKNTTIIKQKLWSNKRSIRDYYWGSARPFLDIQTAIAKPQECEILLEGCEIPQEDMEAFQDSYNNPKE